MSLDGCYNSYFLQRFPRCVGNFSFDEAKCSAIRIRARTIIRPLAGGEAADAIFTSYDQFYLNAYRRL